MAGSGRLLGALASGATGCYKATFIRDPQVSRGVEQDRWENFFLFGLVGEQNFDVREFCPDGRVAQVQTGGNFGNGIVSLLTIGIYTPPKVYVTCATDGRARRLEIDADAQGRPVAAAVHFDEGTPVPATIAPATRPGAWRVSFAEAAP